MKQMAQAQSRSFDRDGFIEDCRKAQKEGESHKAVREVVARAVADRASVFHGLGEPTRAQVQRLHHSPTLTILNVIWGPRMTLRPHNHEMWAVIGIYSGREDNIFWRRLPKEAGGKIEAAGAKALSEGDAVPLGKDIIHSVTNPVNHLSGAIHVYGGDFFAMPRSEWNPGTLLEEPYDVDLTLRLFEESNALLPST